MRRFERLNNCPNEYFYKGRVYKEIRLTQELFDEYGDNMDEGDILLTNELEPEYHICSPWYLEENFEEVTK